MGKRLILMRHAKSSWTSGAPTDHQRPLNKRGRRDAPRIGARLTELGWAPDLVLSSDSERTRETFRRMSGELPPKVDVRFTRAFYGGGRGSIENECREVSDNVDTLLVLGHNPGWEDAASSLCGQWIRMTTANVVMLRSEAESWAQAFDEPWELVEVIRPREL